MNKFYKNSQTNKFTANFLFANNKIFIFTRIRARKSRETKLEIETKRISPLGRTQLKLVKSTVSCKVSHKFKGVDGKYKREVKE